MKTKWFSAGARTHGAGTAGIALPVRFVRTTRFAVAVHAARGVCDVRRRAVTACGAMKPLALLGALRLRLALVIPAPSKNSPRRVANVVAQLKTN